MPDRRRWTAEETQKLVEQVEQHYRFLTEGVTPAKTKAMIEARWDEIVSEINALGSGRPLLSLQQVKQKWSDLKSTSKSAVMKYNKSINKTGGGPSSAKDPTETEWKIVSFIGKSATEGIPGTDDCDTSARSLMQSPSNQLAVIHRPEREADEISMELQSENEDPIRSPLATPLSSKRQRFCPKKRQLEQNEAMLKAENNIVQEVKEVKNELKTLNHLMFGVLEELRKGNEMKAEILRRNDGSLSSFLNI